MKLYIEKLRALLEEKPPDFGNSRSVLAFLYEAYSEMNNLDNAQIKKDFHVLYQCMNGKTLQEMDQILDPICTLCRDHERAGFVEGVKVGLQLSNEIT